MPKTDSVVGPMLSPPTPLMTAASADKILVRTLGPFSLSSNQPMFF
jgi:hypothetical protein